MPEVRTELDDEVYEMAKQMKEEQGRTWNGLISAALREFANSDSPDERLLGLKHDWDEDQRVFPEPGNDRLGSFKAGWTKAENGQEFGQRALNGLSWHNLGWRLGMLFGETPTELKEELYQWCVQQQKETRKDTKE
ncbi:hypothetical protein SAMN05192561_11055 [Halopenitus malekzadehii]|jgi:hypothetical protein|uniref:Uncharacterized protein n=1 Tax=Halopenitus malekzadehii TaxID=1267564 RepID=A0A1H6JAZ2_9EURY|nr:hypothetical protein [Halopenitus malekzadehii]SEH59404.1 hypothetical protein SAMN05192561_11055 [Halopenitus malekzadehii]